jgi:hypothetical protein
MRQRPRPDLAEAVKLGYIFNAYNGVTHLLTELTEFQNFGKKGWGAVEILMGSRGKAPAAL